MRRNLTAARINVKAVVILVVVMGLVGGGVVIGHYVRKRAVADAALAAGKAALGEENWAEACTQLKLYLSKYPDDVDMLEAYGRANVVVRPREPGHIGAAMGGYRRLLRHRPGDAVTCHTLARLYFYVGDHSEAAHICRQRLEADPQDTLAKQWLGEALVALGKTDEGGAILSELVDDHPDQVRAYGVLSYLAGRRDTVTAAEDAARWLDRAVESNPRSARALTQRARFRRVTLNDAVGAQEDLETAASLEPDDPNVLLALATEWVAWNQVDEAQAALTSAAQIDPTEHIEFEIDPEGFTFRRLLAASQLSLLRGEGPEAIALGDAALEELSGARRIAFLPVAVELYMLGSRIERAREAVEELREAGPSRAERAQSAEEQLTLLDAVVSDAEGRPYAVIDLMEDLVSTSPQKSAAWRLLSLAYDRTGQERRSREALERYVTQVPGDWRATLGLARAYRQVDWNKVRKYAERVEQADPTVLEAKLLRCESILRGVAGEPTDARRQQLSAELAQLRKAFPTSVGVRLLEAYLAASAGRVEQAQSVLEDAIAECDDPLAAELQLAALHAGAGRTDEAIELCLAAIARYPDNAGVPKRLAQLQLAAGREDDARATLAQAARELGGRDGLSAALLLAELELARDERTAAIDRLRKLTADYPDDERAFLALLELPEVLGDPQEGQTLVEGLRRVEGEGGLRWQVQQARIWLRQDDWKEHQDQIVERLTKCIQADSGWATPVLVLGQMYEAAGRVVDAERTYRQAVESSPAQFGVAGRLLALLERQGRFVEADQVLRGIPTDAAPLTEHRINVFIGLGEIEPAIEELERRVLAD
ncbi:MAG: tetratricopeptide repeat protein, partial [Planctomycetes bacterium]|nr:tetratricopeptide repeat protein [Planctomycetota bacterium]